jgi:hypothetical protein
MYVAMAADDIALCGQIPTEDRSDKDKVEKCLKNVTSGKTDASICSNIKDARLRDYGCVSVVARNSGDVTVCAGIEDGDRKISCATSVAVMKKDAGLCEKISLPADKMRGSHGKNDCIIEVVKVTKNKASCEEITDNKYAKQDCVKGG